MTPTRAISAGGRARGLRLGILIGSMAGVRLSKRHAVFPRGYRTGRYAQALVYWLADEHSATD